MAIRHCAQEGAAWRGVAGEFFDECIAIADWWLSHAPDEENEGFHGEISYDNVARRDAAKSIILNTRILWFFSELAVLTGDAAHQGTALRAYRYVRDYFVDRACGGVYWMLNAKGDVADGRKHTYAQAFAIYGFSAYYELSGDGEALELALMCFDMIETHARDRRHGGYFEAYAQDWGPLADVRLSDKEDNFPKTMNTHLHVLEALTALAKAMPAKHERRTEILAALGDALAIYCERVVDIETGHLRMFMSEDWQDQSHAYSFGHDIESSWLIDKAIKVLAPSQPDFERYIAQARRLAEVALKDGLIPGEGMADEYTIPSGEFSRSSWWVQAEAMVGFANMWARDGGHQYLGAALSIWRHVRNCYVDREHGEWHWYSKAEVAPEFSEYKIGAWKGPYHNGRAMLLMYKMLS